MKNVPPIVPRRESRRLRVKRSTQVVLPTQRTITNGNQTTGKIVAQPNLENKNTEKPLEDETLGYSQDQLDYIPFLGDWMTEGEDYMSQQSEIQEGPNGGDTKMATKEIPASKIAENKEPRWNNLTKQHTAGLREVEDISSDIEHPGAVASRATDDDYTYLNLRRMKRNTLLKINWDNAWRPRRKNKRQKQDDVPLRDTFDSPNKTKEYQKNAFLFKSSFGGRIVLDEIASQFGYTFVVPGNVTYSMLITFKCKEIIDLHRRRMAKLSTAKSAFYCQLHWEEGYKDSGLVQRTWRDNTLIDNSFYYTLDGYLKSISEAINSATGYKSEYECLCSLIETEKAIHQPGHIDDETCAGVPGEFQPWILHQPLCEEGRTLQIWTKSDKGVLAPKLLHIPFGSACLLRGDIYHGGCYGSKGNIGFHAQLNPGPAEGKFLGILKEHRNERLRETDIEAEKVNSSAQGIDQVKFTQKYLRNMKKMFPSQSLWIQRPQENASWPVERLNLKTT